MCVPGPPWLVWQVGSRPTQASLGILETRVQAGAPSSQPSTTLLGTRVRGSLTTPALFPTHDTRGPPGKGRSLCVRVCQGRSGVRVRWGGLPATPSKLLRSAHQSHRDATHPRGRGLGCLIPFQPAVKGGDWCRADAQPRCLEGRREETNAPKPRGGREDGGSAETGQ